MSLIGNIKVTPACELCDSIVGQRRIVELADCPDGCDGVHIACNTCIRGRGIDPATCINVAAV